MSGQATEAWETARLPWEPLCRGWPVLGKAALFFLDLIFVFRQRRAGGVTAEPWAVPAAARPRGAVLRRVHPAASPVPSARAAAPCGGKEPVLHAGRARLPDAPVPTHPSRPVLCVAPFPRRLLSSPRAQGAAVGISGQTWRPATGAGNTHRALIRAVRHPQHGPRPCVYASTRWPQKLRRASGA